MEDDRVTVRLYRAPVYCCYSSGFDSNFPRLLQGRISEADFRETIRTVDRRFNRELVRQVILRLFSAILILALLATWIASIWWAVRLYLYSNHYSHTPLMEASPFLGGGGGSIAIVLLLYATSRLRQYCIHSTLVKVLRFLRTKNKKFLTVGVRWTLHFDRSHWDIVMHHNRYYHHSGVWIDLEILREEPIFLTSEPGGLTIQTHNVNFEEDPEAGWRSDDGRDTDDPMALLIVKEG